jgi:hypothetical protein
MHMVRHEAKTEDIYLAFDGVMADQAHVSESVLIVEKRRRSIIAALGYVMKEARDNQSGGSRHTFEVPLVHGSSHTKTIETSGKGRGRTQLSENEGIAPRFFW